MPKNKINWLLDGAIFLGFLSTFFLDWTGLSGHQWIGAAVGALMFYHLLAHWNWVITVSRRFFGRTSGRSRLFYLIDCSLFLSALVIGFSGLGISTWIGLELANYLLWKDVHIYSSVLSLGFILLKIALHWRWIISTAAKYFGLWHKPAPAAAPLRSGPTPGALNRREFLQLMGVASLGALISASNLLEFGRETGEEIIHGQTTSPAIQDSGLSPAPQDCVLACDKGCSYPGQCRRYVDLNSNGICDLTECSEAGSPSPSAQLEGDTEPDPGQEAVKEITPQVVEEDCQVPCPIQCLFPGQCRDYIDLNANGLCDLGECLLTSGFAAAEPARGGRQHRGGK